MGNGSWSKSTSIKYVREHTELRRNPPSNEVDTNKQSDTNTVLDFRPPHYRFNPIDMRPYGNLGLRSKGIQIHFPLSPKVVLSFSDPSTYDSFGESHETKDIQNVIFENSLQVAHSTRHIFSKINDFSLTERMLKDDSSLKDIRKKRIAIH